MRQGETGRPGLREGLVRFPIRGLVVALAAFSLPLQAQESFLPPVKVAPHAAPVLSESIRVFVREFRFTGHTVFSSAELARVVASFTQTNLHSGQLEEARHALTRHYVDHGYINSGAILDDQPVSDGVITFRIVEGKLTEIEIENPTRLRHGFIKNRLQRGAGDPLNLTNLQNTLLLFKENPNLRQINAELKPGMTRGEARLELKVTEKNPWHLGLAARNDRPPSVGAEALEVLASNQNVTGISDALDLRYGLAQRSRDSLEFSGTDNWGASYRIPINTYDTSIQVAYSRSDYALIEEPFDSLEIESRSDVYTIGVRHPLYRTPRRELSMTVAADRRHTESFLLGEPFSFSPGAVNGEATISALRFTHEWVDRSQDRVIALRSTLSWGIDVLGSTDDGTERDGKQVTWLGQAQYVRRLALRGSQLILSGNFQWTEGPLLSLEQMSLGGAHTVRGYRENQLVRDQGAVLTLELRIPILFTKAGGPMLQVAPFVDYGNGWNVEGPKGNPRDIASAGLGLLFTLHEKVQAELYWGHAFRNFNHPARRDAQDLGLHFKLVAMAF